MGKLNDLKKEIYGGFIKYLDSAGIGDFFSNDVWASKIFDKIYERFEDDIKLTNYMNRIPIAEIEKFIEIRKQEKSKIIQPKKDIKIIK